MSVPTISVQRLSELQSQGCVEVIDVRTPAEFREVHIPIARNVPLDSLKPRRVMEARNGSAAEPLHVICGSGKRSAMACEKFLAAGYTNVFSVDGGTRAWADTGLPLVRGKKTLSLERQVQLTAGSMVLLGVALSQWHPYFLGLSAFIGAGLIFTGITDNCAMGLLLAKMPWNQASCCPQTGCSSG